MAQRWCTKEDVLKDLELASGRQVADVNDEYFVYGSQAPPHAIDIEDEEMDLRFGAACERPLQGDLPGPDLFGITEMLRMVQKYDQEPDLSEEEIPNSANKKVVISKAHVSQEPIRDKKHSSIKDGDNLKSPNKRQVTNKTQAKGETVNLNEELNLNKNEVIDKVVSNRTHDNESSRKLALNNRSSSKTTQGSSCYEVPVSNGLAADKEVTPAKVVTNNGIVFSKLNPFVKEFIPRSAQIEPKVTEENFNVTHVTNAQNKDVTKTISNKRLVKEIDDSKIKYESSVTNAQIKDVTKTISNKRLVKEIDDAKIKYESNAIENKHDLKENKKQKAKMLRNQISTKNDTFEDRQQTNRAIVNLLKLYADPKPAKPLKLLTPQFFEQCKATNFKDESKGHNEIDSSIERMASLHDVKEVNVDMNPCISQESIAENQGAMSAFGTSENSDIPTKGNVDREEKIDHVEKNVIPDIKLTLDACDNDEAEEFERNIHAFCKKNDNNNIDNETKEKEEFNETQLTPDMGNVNMKEIQVNDPYMKESISKVTNWLEDKPVVTVVEKSSSPRLFLGPVAYKRKDPVTCKSPSEIADKKVPKASQNEYKPSDYAIELHKKYSQRSKNKTPTPTLNIWEKLEADLKKKDLEIKNRNKTLRSLSSSGK